MKFLFRSQHYHSNNHLHHHRHNQRLLIACCFDFNIDHRGPSRDFQEVFCQQGSFKRPGCVLWSCPWFCCDIKHQRWELCSLAGASIGPVATSTYLSCFRIRVPFYLCATWFFTTFQTLTSALEVDCIRLVQFRTRNIDWVWRRYSTTAIWVKYRAGRGAVLNWKGCEAGRIDQGVTNRLVARDRLLSFLVSQKPLHPVSRPGKITMVALVEMSR